MTLATESTPKIAVLLAAFNGVSWLNEQVESVLSQEDVSVSLYISVDLSSDGTEDLINQLSLKDSRIKVLPYGNHFGGAAANFYHLFKYLDLAQFDFVALSDQDDIWNSDKLHTAITQLREKNLDAYSSNITAFWPDGRKKLINKAQRQVQWDFLFEAAGPGCTYVIKKSLALEFQLFIENHWGQVQKIYLHDWLLYAFSRSKQYKWYIDPKPSMLYRQHPNNQVGANIGLQAFLIRAKKILNGWGLNQSLLISQAIGLDSNIFVSSWAKGNRLGYLKLGVHFWQCRRKPKDKFLFLMACISLAILPPKKKQIKHLKVDTLE